MSPTWRGWLFAYSGTTCPTRAGRCPQGRAHSCRLSCHCHQLWCLRCVASFSCTHVLSAAVLCQLAGQKGNVTCSFYRRACMRTQCITCRRWAMLPQEGTVPNLKLLNDVQRRRTSLHCTNVANCLLQRMQVNLGLPFVCISSAYVRSPISVHT